MSTTTTMTKTENPVYVGDIFHGSFGYDMTINCFWEVTRVSPSGKTIWVRELKSECSWEDPHSGAMRCRAIITGDDRFTGPEIRKRVHTDCETPWFRAESFMLARRLDNEHMLDGFYENHMD